MTRAPIAAARSATAACLALLALAACRGPQTAATADYTGPGLPRPERFLVSDFAVAPDDIRLDQGIRARLMRAADDQPASADRLAVARDVQRVVTETVVAELRQHGLPTAPATARAEQPGNSVLVEGQIVAIDQGNQTRRTLIGLGAGQSNVTADGQVYYRRGSAAPIRLVSVEGRADSGRAPGAAETMGVGAAAGTGIGASVAASTGLHMFSEKNRASSEAEARSLGQAIAARLLAYFAQMGWVAA